MTRRAVFVVLLVSMAGGFEGTRSAPAGPPEPESLGVQVNRAVDRGVTFVKALQNPDGSFRGDSAPLYPAGETALALYALAKSQVTDADPVVPKAVAFMKGRPVAKTYEAAAGILALDALKDPAHDEWIRGAARWLEEHVHAKDGVWAYPVGPNADYAKTDLSNTQFAALGLWVAERHGYQAKRELWAELARRLPDYQTPFGAFRYSLNRGEVVGSGSMTTAGLTVLALALDRIPQADAQKAYAVRARRALKDGWAYLERRFTVEANLEGDFAYRVAAHHYFLYGLERVAALAAKKTIAGRDWYQEGARLLVGSQAGNGAWGTLDDTCFALLFLRKATATMLDAGAPSLPEGPGTGPAAAGPGYVKPGDAVRFVSRWLVLGPFDNADDSGLHTELFHEPSILPRAGQRTEKRTWTLHHTREPFLSLRHAVGAGDHSLSYAFVYLHAARETDVVLWFDHDDGARVWLDGRLVHDRHYHQAAAIDRRQIAARLAPGSHGLLFKVEEWWGNSGLYLRIAHPDGTLAPEVVSSPSPDAPDAAEVARNHPDAYPHADLLAGLPVDTNLRVAFDREEDLERMIVRGVARGYPRWIWRAERRRDQPHPGGAGFLAVHPASPQQAAEIVRRLRLPPGFPLLRLRVSADPYEVPVGTGDFRLDVAVFDGALHPLASQVVEAGPPSPDGWRTVDVDLRDYAGKDVLLVITCAPGGKDAWHNEEAFFDEASILVR